MSRVLSALTGAAALIGLAAASPASATLLNFQLTGSNQASFQLQSTAPSSFLNFPGIDTQTFFSNVSGTFGGVAEVGNVNFGTGAAATFNISAPGSFGSAQLVGMDLFTGPPSDPVFNLGSFSLNNIFFGLHDTLTITQVAAVPEPSTWAMMILGFFGVGFMAYRRKQSGPALRLT
jgi:hypothetical protein